MPPRPSIGKLTSQWRHFITKRWSTTASFTVYGSGSKQALIQKVRRDLGLRKKENDNAVVILASQGYAKWLEDIDFMTQLLEFVTPKTSSSGSSGLVQHELNVLAAAVDGLPPSSRLGNAQLGFSICYGPSDRVLPRLWTDEAETGRSKTRGVESDGRAAITLRLGESLGPESRAPVSFTLPLANTVFENSRRSTLLASSWTREGPESALRMTKMASQQNQLVCYSSPEAPAPSVSVPVLPITPPREISAGLGNIVRRVQVDGQDTPASKELEVAVQDFYDRRSLADGGAPRGPIGVWAVVVPPGAGKAAVSDLAAWFEESSRDIGRGHTSEWDLAGQSSNRFSSRLMSGTRIYQVLSGGGGWGKKQGLLSLDPDTKFQRAQNEDDLEAFIRSFKGEEDDGARQSIVVPGSHIQFFVAVEPELKSQGGNKTAKERFGTGASFGVTPYTAESAASPDKPGEQEWELVHDVFGAVSSECLYVSQEEAANGTGLGLAGSKITVPASYVTWTR